MLIWGIRVIERGGGIVRGNGGGGRGMEAGTIGATFIEGCNNDVGEVPCSVLGFEV